MSGHLGRVPGFGLADLARRPVHCNVPDAVESAGGVLFEEFPLRFLGGHVPGFDTVLVFGPRRGVVRNIHFRHNAGLVDFRNARTGLLTSESQLL